MSYLSNRLIFLFYKYVSLAISLLFIFFLYDSIASGGIDKSNLIGLLILLFISLSFVVFFIGIRKVLVEVEISNSFFKIPTKNLSIKWENISVIDFNWLGLYKIEYLNQVFYFPPYDMAINFFGVRLSTTDFDELIERKKIEYDI